MRIQSALDRVTRTLVLSIGIGSVLFTLLGLPTDVKIIAALDAALDDYDTAARDFWHAAERVFDTRSARDAAAEAELQAAA